MIQFYKNFWRIVLLLTLFCSAPFGMEDLGEQLKKETRVGCASPNVSDDKMNKMPSDEVIETYFNNSCRVDLHGQSEEEAKSFVISIIQQLQSTGDQIPASIHFITGRGKHINSKGNRGTLFKNFPLWLQDKKVSHLVRHCQETIGAYEVFLKSAGFKPDQSKHKALKLDVIRQWAEFGEPQAQYLLGEMYAMGNKVVKDNKLSVFWFRKSAEQENMEAQLNLGYMCAMGMGTRYNPQEALKWYTRAGNQGCARAWRNIAVMHLTGEGVQKNIRKAIDYFLKAANLNDLVSMNQLGIFYRQIGKDEEAVKWDRKAAEKGEPHAKVNLGVMLILGQGVDKDEVEGFKWLQKAAEYGIVEGQLRLGTAYEEGTGIEQNYVEALRWYLKAGLKDAGWPSADAQWKLWYLYSEGKGVKPNEVIANRWLIRAADNGQAKAQVELARRYKFGTSGFEPNIGESFKYYNLAAKQGNPNAQYELGELYEFGGGNLKPNPKKGNRLIRKAALNGHFFARLMLGMVYREELPEFESFSISEETNSGSDREKF